MINVKYLLTYRRDGEKGYKMLKNKNGLLKSEIEKFYRNTPEGFEVLETRIFSVSLMKYITIKLEYI